jgi:long-chain acyl-CoA synthetase
MNGVTRIFDLLEVSQQHYKADEPVLFGKKNGQVLEVDRATYHRNSYVLAHALIESGIQKGERVATIINNRPEWNFFDMAICLAGAVQVPVYPTISPSQIQFIFNDAAITGLVVNDAVALDRISGILGDIPSLKFIVSIDDTAGTICMNDLLQKYHSFYPSEKVRGNGEQHQH